LYLTSSAQVIISQYYLQLSKYKHTVRPYLGLSLTKSEHSLARDSTLIDSSIAASIDEVLGEMLGETVVETFYVYLSEHDIRRKDLHRKVKELCKVLDSTFDIEAESIRRGIARRLFTKLQLPFSPVQGKRLYEYVEGARKAMSTAQAYTKPSNATELNNVVRGKDSNQLKT